MPKFSETTHQRVEFSDEEVKDLLKNKAQEHGLGLRAFDDLEVHYTVLEHQCNKRLIATVVYNGAPAAVPHGAGAGASSDPDMMQRMKLQSEEFEAMGRLADAFNSLPAIVDDDYPAARHRYESELHTFLEALALNGRFAPQSRGALMLNRGGVRVMEKN